MAGKQEFIVQFNCLTAYKGKKKEVVIPEGVTVIGRRAFFLNSSIESVTLPASVTTIEQEAFLRCRNLQAITILGRIEKIGTNAFDSFYDKKELELYLCSRIPISAFTKAAQEDAIRRFFNRFSEFEKDSDVFRDNIAFIGSHLKLELKYGHKVYEYLIDSEEFRHAILSADAIPAKDIDWLTEAVQAAGKAELTAELLEYKNRLLSDNQVRKALEKSAERAEEKAFSGEISAAEWRKRLKFAYENENIVIKEVKTWEPVTVIPSKIGNRYVRIIDSFAINHWCKQAEADKLVISEGIEEIRRLAFIFAKNIEVFFPSSITVLPAECFNAVSDLTLHIPASVAEISDGLESESVEPAFKAICAPAGSYAEQYAKEHGIPFVAE